MTWNSLYLFLTTKRSLHTDKETDRLCGQGRQLGLIPSSAVLQRLYLSPKLLHPLLFANCPLTVSAVLQAALLNAAIFCSGVTMVTRSLGSTVLPLGIHVVKVWKGWNWHACCFTYKPRSLQLHTTYCQYNSLSMLLFLF